MQSDKESRHFLQYGFLNVNPTQNLNFPIYKDDAKYAKVITEPYVPYLAPYKSLSKPLLYYIGLPSQKHSL